MAGPLIGDDALSFFLLSLSFLIFLRLHGEYPFRIILHYGIAYWGVFGWLVLVQLCSQCIISPGS